MKEEHLILLEYVGKKGLKNRMMEEGAKMIKIKNSQNMVNQKYAVKDFSLEIDPENIWVSWS